MSDLHNKGWICKLSSHLKNSACLCSTPRDNVSLFSKSIAMTFTWVPEGEHDNTPLSLFEFPNNRREKQMFKKLTLLKFSSGERLPYCDQWCNLLNICNVNVRRLTLFECEVVSWRCSWPDLRLDHVDAAGAEGFDTVVDIHHAFALGHVQHDIQHDVAAGAARPHAATQRTSLVRNRAR